MWVTFMLTIPPRSETQSSRHVSGGKFRPFASSCCNEKKIDWTYAKTIDVAVKYKKIDPRSKLMTFNKEHLNERKPRLS